MGFQPMSKYKINIDKPLPSDKKIEQYKSFDSLYREYQVITRFQFWRDLYKKPKYFAAAAAVAAIVFLVGQAVVEEASNSAVVQNEQLSLENVTTPFQLAQVNANQTSVIALSEESQLTIPANAFVDQNQNVVSGEVELRYREIQESTSIIPTEQNLESIALLEVEAYLDGKKVFLAEDKSIEVAYITSEGNPNYNVYELNPVEKLWSNSGKDEVIVLAPTGEIPPRPEYPQLAQVIDQLVPKIVVKEPLKPFRIKAELSDFPELQPLQGANWVHAGTNHKTDPWANNIIGQNWDDVLVKKLENDRYEITFTRRDAKTQQTTSFQTIARPEYGGLSYDEALEAYDHLLKQYQETLDKKAQDEEALKAVEEENKKTLAQYEKELKEWEAQYGSQQNANAAPKYRRTFKVKNLGIHCIGKPVETSKEK